jgi:predicted permease
MVLGVIAMIFAMPVATMTSIFASKYKGDVYTASQSVFISTLLSVGTIPAFLYIMKLLGSV